MAFLPTNELVAMAWLRQRVPGFDGIVGTNLPGTDQAGVLPWATSGFVQVQHLSGASTSVDLPQMRMPRFQVDFWATATTQGKPRWHAANALAEALVVATETQEYGKPVTLPTGYMNARVHAAYLLTEPVRVPDDPAGYARYTVDLFALDWTRVPS